MKSVVPYPVIIIGFALFAMLFGASNLIFPIEVGATAGSHLLAASLGFLLTAVFLPFTGLVTMMLFDGNYREFFQRVGKKSGDFLIFLCMLIIGPLVGIPRIILLAHRMLTSFVPINLVLFSVLFLLVALLCALSVDNLVKILGYFFGPLIMVLLGIFIVKGFLRSEPGSLVPADSWHVFVSNVKYGFSTLDLLGALFLGSLLLTMLKQTVKYVSPVYLPNFALTCVKGGLVGSVLMVGVYSALMYLSALHAGALSGVHADLVFVALANSLVGSVGWPLIVVTVLVVCLSTALALISTVAHYVCADISRTHLGYVPSALLVSVISFVVSLLNIHYIERITYGPVALVLYPVIIMLMLCNLAYKTYGVRAIKIPVALTLLGSLSVYFYIVFLR